MAQPISAGTFWANYWKDIYSTPRAWAHKGERLVHAFEAVVAATDPSHNMLDQAFMLAGMAIEVMLKSILISTPKVKRIVVLPKKPDIPDEKAIWNAFYSHDLSSLAKQATMSLSDDEVIVADVLAEFIYWRGRYVVPTQKGIGGLESWKIANGRLSQHHSQISIEAVRSLVERTVNEVKSRLYQTS